MNAAIAAHHKILFTLTFAVPALSLLQPQPENLLQNDG
jgi:hypothetical protein